MDGQRNWVFSISQNQTVRYANKQNQSGRRSVLRCTWISSFGFLLCLGGQWGEEEGILRFSFDLKTKLASTTAPRIGALVCCCEWLVWGTAFLKGSSRPSQESHRWREGSLFPDVSLCKYGANVNLCWDCGEWCWGEGAAVSTCVFRSHHDLDSLLCVKLCVHPLTNKLFHY